MSDQSPDTAAGAPVDADEYARLLTSLERFAQEVPHLGPAELVRRTQAFDADLATFVPMHADVVALLRRVAERAAAGLDELPDVDPDDPEVSVPPAGPPDGGATPKPAVEVQPLPRRRDAQPPPDDDVPF